MVLPLKKHLVTQMKSKYCCIWRQITTSFRTDKKPNPLKMKIPSITYMVLNNSIVINKSKNVFQKTLPLLSSLREYADLWSFYPPEYHVAYICKLPMRNAVIVSVLQLCALLIVYSRKKVKALLFLLDCSQEPLFYLFCSSSLSTY